ncbi:MAG: hypothetical protein A2275_06060, partial [Bacteroidetes bacterium RIFOXYA12_FULL_35_11]
LSEITANFGKAGETRKVEKEGKQYDVTDFSVVINEKDKEPKWINCVAWGDKASKEISEIKPGTELHLSGVMKQNEHEGKTRETFTAYSFAPTIQERQGFVVSDIEAKIVGNENNLQVANFSIGINKGKEEPEFIKCTAWNKVAEQVNGLKKGDEILLHGKFGKDKIDNIVLEVNKVQVISLKQDRLDASLMKAVKEGDVNKVTETIKNGADIQKVTPEHIKAHDPEMQELLKQSMKTGIAENNNLTPNVTEKAQGMKI